MSDNIKCWECNLTPVPRTGQVCPTCRLRLAVEEQTKLQQEVPRNNRSRPWNGWADFTINTVPAVIALYLAYKFWAHLLGS